MFICSGDYVVLREYPDDPVEVLSVAACEYHPYEDHEGLLVWHPSFSFDSWVCQLTVTPVD